MSWRFSRVMLQIWSIPWIPQPCWFHRSAPYKALTLALSLH